MGSFGGMLWVLLWLQTNADPQVKNPEPDALFTEVPHDIISQTGEDVEMSCSFRGAGSSSVSLEIQWWYTRHFRDWPEKPAWMTNQVVPHETKAKGAVKISVVKVVGSNISHKLRLSSVKLSDEGTYECRVIDFSESRANQHSVQAYLQVQPEVPDHLVQQERPQLLSEGHSDHDPSERENEIKDGDGRKKSEPNLGHENHREHQKSLYVNHHGYQMQEREPRTEEEDRQFYKGTNQQILEGNKTREAEKHQLENREFIRHATRVTNDCPTEDCTL